MDSTVLAQVLTLGVVEGLTEFLPVSSTGHLILLTEVLGFRAPPGRVFEIGIQLGAILAVLWVYRAMLARLLRRMWHLGTWEFHMARNLALAVLPALVLGALLHGVVTRLLFDPVVVCAALIVGGAILIAVERTRPPPSLHSVSELSAGRALLVGFGQVLAMVPGTSRSGATVVLALLLGMERRAAAEFSFLLAIPTMAAATAFSLYKARDEIHAGDLAMVAVGGAAAFVVALLAVRAVLRVIGRTGWAPFGWYRIALGAVMLGWLAMR